MRLNAPKVITFLISLILVALAIIGYFVRIPFVTRYCFWILTAGYAVLAAGTLFKGL